MAARRGKSQARRNGSSGLPGWAWLVIGILIALLAVLIAPRFLKGGDGDGFLRIGPKPNPDALPASVDGVEPDIVRVRSLPVRVVVADPLVSDDDVVPVGFELLPEDGDEEEEACANMRLTAQRAIPLVKARRSRRPEREFGGLIFITRRQTR